MKKLLPLFALLLFHNSVGKPLYIDSNHISAVLDSGNIVYVYIDSGPIQVSETFEYAVEQLKNSR